MIRRWIFWRDERLSRRDMLALAGIFAVALVVAFPLRVALAWATPQQVSAREASGTIWSGAIQDLRVGALPLGSVKARLRPLQLLVWRPELHVERPGPAGAPEFAANGSGGAGWARLSDVEGTVPLGDSFGGIPASSLAFKDFRVAMRDGRCAEASGKMSLILRPLSQLMPGPVTLTGEARCNGGALFVPMTGSTGMERLFLRVQPNGDWQADLVLSGLPVEISAQLLESGFGARPGGIGISASGSL